MPVEGRLMKIRRLLDANPVGSQDDLVGLLAAEGVEVTQATVSRDLRRLGAIKIRAGGVIRYAIPEEAATDPAVDLVRLLAARGRSMTASGNLLVVRTGVGAAQVVAAAIDALGDTVVAGTVAGDDTIIVVAAEGHTGRDLQSLFESIGVRE